MPAAFYEFNIEQSSTFLSALKILKPDGSLFKFVPNVGEAFWADSTTLNFDVPEEIKTLYPDNNNSFGYLKGTSGPFDFLTLRMQIKDPSVTTNTTKIQGKIKCTKSNGGGVVIATEAPTGSIKEALFSFPRPIVDHNILLNIPSDNTNFKGKYFYDIEMEYKLGTTTTTGSYVIRLLQGKVTFNPNITTLT